MAPKGKPKAKAAAKQQAGGGEEEKLHVPQPPPTPVPVKFPDNFSEENSSARCALLTWRDRSSQYKLQTRSYVDKETNPDEGWSDLEQVQQRPLGGRSDVYFVAGLQHVRAEYRLALKSGESTIDGKIVMNWFSAPSDPVVSIVDTPAKPSCGVMTRDDYSSVAVQLTFRSTNPDVSDSASREITDTGPWAGFPGINISKVQCRWRALRHAQQDEIREQGGEAAAIEYFFAGAKDGEKRNGPLVEVGSDCKFDASTGTWSFRFGEVPHGLLARFEVRVGTAYRWSPWSEESDDVPVVIRPPRPTSEPGVEGIVTVVSTSDSTAKVQWEPFALADGMALCEYRVMVCQLASAQGGDATSHWDPGSARVVGIFTVRSDSEPVEFEAKGLVADTFYLVKVDARYPFVGERGWSVHAITKDAAHTSFATRPPPLAPMPLPTNHIEQLIAFEDLPFGDDSPWLALLVEHSAYHDYRIEFSKSFEPGSSEETEDLQIGSREWSAAAEVVPLGVPHGTITNIDASEGKAWMAVAALLSEGETWDLEAVAVRLRHQRPATVSPHLATGSTSMPLVPKIAPPAHCSASVRWSTELGSFGVQLRFYLGTALPENATGSDLLGVVADLRAASMQKSGQDFGRQETPPESEKAESTPERPKVRTSTSVHLQGHRFVTFYQVRVRSLSGDAAVILPPRSLMAPNARSPDLQLGPLPQTVLSGPESAAAFVWDAGDHHEAWLEAADCFKLGSEYEVDVRVGSSTRWSPWSSIPDKFSYVLPVPKPLPGRSGRDLPARLHCNITSPTSVCLRFPPFLLSPGAAEAEYLIAAIPMSPDASEAADSEAEAAVFSSLFQDSGTPSQRGAEGSVPVAKRLVARRRAIKTDHEAVQVLLAKGSFADLQEISELALMLHLESEEDLDLIYRSVEEEAIEVNLGGLLPATKYKFQVAARYAFKDAQISPALSEVAETICGDGPPAAPTPLSVEKLAAAPAIGPGARAVVLEIEDRADYVLECKGALMEADEGWYPLQASDDGGKPASNGKVKAGAAPVEAAEQRWWNTSEEAAAGQWSIVSTRVLEAVPPRTGFSCVVVDLPEFGTAKGSSRMNVDLPDLMWFRLRVADRSGSHPCRWLGNMADAIVTCIAPLAAPPLPKRHFADSSWHVNVSFFLHKKVRPSPLSVAEVRKAAMTDSALSILLNSDAEPNLFDGESGDDQPEDAECLEIPVGYGHRKVVWVQARAQLVGGRAPNGDESSYRSMARDWIELQQIPLHQCKVQIPSAFRGSYAERTGELHQLSISGTDSLREGGVYQVQIRVGNGHRWSGWSASSRRFTYGVPQPVPVQGSLEVETLSSNLARLKWPAFSVPDTVSEVEYLLKAKPVWNASSLQGVHVVYEAHVLTAETPGDGLEAELSNLMPAVEYTFSVSARYPRIGWRAWSTSLTCEPQCLDDKVADWPSPPAPVVVPHSGPRPFALQDGYSFFHPNERALLVGFPETAGSSDGMEYQLEYKHIGMLPDSGNESGIECANIWPIDYRTEWTTPVEVVSVKNLETESAHMLKAMTSPWKVPPMLWRVRLPGPRLAAGEQDSTEVDAAVAQLQRVQLRLVAKARGECPMTRWFSAPSPPICAGIAPPLNARAKLDIADSHLTVQVSFALDIRLAPGSFSGAATGATALKQLEGVATEGMFTETDLPRQLPKGFCHGFVTRVQVRSRHSPRPPADQPAERGRKPHGVPWSAWADSPDTDIESTTSELDANESHIRHHSSCLALPGGIPLEYGSWYQVSFRVSDGICWSDWCEPSTPVKVFVAPPKPERPDTDELVVDRSMGGNNVTLRWSPIRAHGGLRLVDYALFVREVLHDRTDICPRQLAALIPGHAAKAELERRTEYDQDEKPTKMRGEKMSFELRDLRQDVTYVFTLSARYPNIGPRDFEDALSSAPTSLRPGCAPLPVPMQLPLPPERLKRMQGMRCVLLKWSLLGLPAPQKEADEEQEKHTERHYDLQALPEGAKDHEWVICKNVSRTKIDGAVAWFVKDVPGQALRSRFRLWDRDTGRFGRTSPLMLTLVEPVTKIGAVRVIAESGAQIVLRAPLYAKHGSHEFVCRYQVRFRPEHMDSEWTELPIQMLWHRQNDHLATLDVPVDGAGAVISGLSTDPRSDALSKAVSFGANLARQAPATTTEDGEHATNGGGEEVVRTPGFPMIPLATVGPAGDVSRQHCLVAILREEDGLNLMQSYAFSVRVGDLYRLSEWSDPSAVVKLAVPPPMMGPDLSEDHARIRVSDVTDTALFATWPRFMPALNAGVPIHCEVEYLLVVAPQIPKKKVVGRGRPQEAELHPHSQWLLSSVIPKDTPQDKIEQDLSMRVAVTGLNPHTVYELRLSVRYARIGTRKWSEAINLAVQTKKADLETVRAAKERVSAANERVSAAADELSLLRRFEQKSRISSVPPDISKRVDQDIRVAVVDSPRRLPPLDPGLAAQRGLDAPSTAEPTVISAPSDSEPMAARKSSAPADSEPIATRKSSDLEDWMAVTQADADRIIGGMAAAAGMSANQAARRLSPKQGAAGEPAEAVASGEDPNFGYPARPADHVPFWRRDPMDVRPAMPMMPPAGHSAMQLDLVGRDRPWPVAAGGDSSGTSAAVLPRPPSTERHRGRPQRPMEDRTAYPRRFIYE